ncbi:hypothetical protein QDQ27_12830 [Enterobacter hormaechei]|uniref:hypothetical protein n=1 Tax=Enterobacter hormaechei TaxID=158836 RepID=UPI00335C4E25
MDDCEGNKNCDVVKELARIALASIEAEPVAWLLSGGGAKNNVSFDSGNAYADPLREVTPLYTATPAPVSVPAAMEMDDDFDSAFEHGKAVGWNACRAAMLQGAEPVTTAYKLPAEAVYGYFAFNDHHGEEFFKKREDAIAFCKEAIEEYRQENAEEGCDHDEVRRTCWGIIMKEGTDFEVDNEGHIDYALTPELAGDSPVIPDGWVAVPVEPTEHMIVEGFESEPDEFFSDAELWEAYNAMTGCQQAAHRAKLCWAAMIAASQKS